MASIYIGGGPLISSKPIPIPAATPTSVSTLSLEDNTPDSPEEVTPDARDMSNDGSSTSQDGVS